MNIMKKTIFALVSMCIILLLGCTPQLTGKVVEQKDVIKMGGLFHLTGAGAFWGIGEKNSAVMAIEEINANGGINGQKIELIIEDTQTDFTQITTATKKLFEVDNVDIIIGPTWFGQAGAPLAEQAKKIMISPSAGTVPQPSKYFFALWPTEEQEVIPTADFMKSQGVKRVAVVYSLNDWSESVKNEFVKRANENNIKVIAELPTNPDENDFRTTITRIKALNVDAVYAPFAFYPSQGSFSKQAKDLKLGMPIYSSSGTENPVLLQSFPEIEGTIYPYPAISSVEKKFAEEYFKQYNMPASPPAAYAYDAVNLIAQALKNGKQTPDEISEYLHTIKYNGISNQISFDEDGRVTQKQHEMKIVRNGEFVKYE